MTSETAREIIKQALADETWETPAPEDDDQAITDAEALVKMAEDAWEQNIRGPEVEAILRIAAADEDADAEAAPAAKAKPKAAPKASKPAAPAKPKPGRPKAAEPDTPALEEPWENYDTDAVKEIVEGVQIWGEDLDENLPYIVALYAYEQANKNRKKITDACEAIIPADSLPEADAAPDEDPVDSEAVEVPEEWASEPFDTYDKLTVADIKDSLTAFFEDDEYTEEQKLDVLNHTTHYEQSNKNRSGLIDYLEGIRAAYEEAAGGDETREATEEGQAEGAAAPEADAPAASRPASGKSAGKKAGSAAGARASGDGATFTVKAAIGSSTYETELGGKHAVAGMVLDLIESGATSISIDA